MPFIAKVVDIPVVVQSQIPCSFWVVPDMPVVCIDRFRVVFPSVPDMPGCSASWPV